MLLVLMLFLLSRSRGITRFLRLRTALLLLIFPGLLRLPDRELWILQLIILRLFWMVIRLTELINNFFRCFDFLCMMCEERTAVSFFGVAVFFFVWWMEVWWME